MTRIEELTDLSNKHQELAVHIRTLPKGSVEFKQAIADIKSVEAAMAEWSKAYWKEQGIDIGAPTNEIAHATRYNR